MPNPHNPATASLTPEETEEELRYAENAAGGFLASTRRLELQEQCTVLGSLLTQLRDRCQQKVEEETMPASAPGIIDAALSALRTAAAAESITVP